MEINSKQLEQLKTNGLTAQCHNLEGFSEAVYDQNNFDDICNFETDDADDTDLKTWSITVGEWRAAQRHALECAMYEYIESVDSNE